MFGDKLEPGGTKPTAVARRSTARRGAAKHSAVRNGRGRPDEPGLGGTFCQEKMLLI